jgi:hypothetical protein
MNSLDETGEHFRDQKFIGEIFERRGLGFDLRADRFKEALAEAAEAAEVARSRGKRRGSAARRAARPVSVGLDHVPVKSASVMRRGASSGCGKPPSA